MIEPPNLLLRGGGPGVPSLDGPVLGDNFGDSFEFGNCGEPSYKKHSINMKLIEQPNKIELDINYTAK